MNQIELGGKKYELTPSIGALRRACGRVKMDIIDFQESLSRVNLDALYSIVFELTNSAKTMSYDNFCEAADALPSISMLANPALTALTEITKTSAKEGSEKKS
jgi:hypothetical protein